MIPGQLNLFGTICACGRPAVGHSPVGDGTLVCRGHNERAWAAGARRIGDHDLARRLELAATRSLA